MLSDTYRSFLNYFYDDPTNIPLIFYLALLSFFVKSPAYSKEYLDMIETVYQLDFKDRGYALVDYYYERSKTLERRLISACSN